MSVMSFLGILNVVNISMKRTNPSTGKSMAAFEHKLTPIVCVGESLEERESGKTVELVADQVKKAFEGISAEQAEKAVIAYEPIWAIGTGKTATAEDANEVCGAIRATVGEMYSEEVAGQHSHSIRRQCQARKYRRTAFDGTYRWRACRRRKSRASFILEITRGGRT